MQYHKDDGMYHLCVYDYITSGPYAHLVRELAPLLILKKQAAMLWTGLQRGPRGKQLRVISSQKQEVGPWSNSLQGTEYCNHVSLEVDPFIVEPQLRSQLRVTPWFSLVRPWNRGPLSCACTLNPRNPWDNKCLLFEDAKFVVKLLAAIEN